MEIEHDTTNWKFDFMYLYSTVCLSVYFAVLKMKKFKQLLSQDK